MTRADGRFVVAIEPDHTEVAVFYGTVSKTEQIADLCRQDAVIGIHSQVTPDP